jgi:hypothetical protein
LDLLGLTTVDPLCVVAWGNYLRPAQLGDEQTRCYQHPRYRRCLTFHYDHWLASHAPWSRKCVCFGSRPLEGGAQWRFSLLRYSVFTNLNICS